MRFLPKTRRRAGFCTVCLVLLLAALTLTDLARPTVVNAALEYNETIRFQDDFDACSGERVLVDGTQHIVGRFSKDAAGRLHFGFTRNTYGTGIGYTSGDQYILIDTVSRSSVELVTGVAQTYIDRFHGRLIRRGEVAQGDDTLLQFVTKITLNANGDTTAAVEIENVTCG
jgi:hypothetical protein